MLMKNSNTIIYRTRDLPACNAVPQPTEPPRAPCLYIQCIKVLNSCTSTGAPRPPRVSFNQHVVLSSNWSSFYFGRSPYESRTKNDYPDTNRGFPKTLHHTTSEPCECSPFKIVYALLFWSLQERRGASSGCVWRRRRVEVQGICEYTD
jgi:hypothetical protein